MLLAALCLGALLAAAPRAQEADPGPDVAALRQRAAEAVADFVLAEQCATEIYGAVRHPTLSPADQVDLLEAGCAALLPWALAGPHQDDAAPLLGALAFAACTRLLAHDEVDRARALVEQAWPARTRMGYRACAFALEAAEARRRSSDWDGAQAALDFYRQLDKTAWQSDAAMQRQIAGFDLLLPCRQALLDLALGNPDEALRQLRIADGRRAGVASGMVLLEYSRSRVDYLLGTERFAAAARVADTTLEQLQDGTGVHALFSLYRDIAVLADAGADAATQATAAAGLRALLEADQAPMPQKIAEQLARWDLDRGDVAAAGAVLDRVADPGAAAADDPVLTTLRSEALLLATADRPLTEVRDRLAAQRMRQADALQGLLQHWRQIPARPGGVGFLHFLTRRDVVATLVELSLRLDPGEAGIAAALGCVLQAQAMGSLAQWFGVAVPDLAAVRRCLGERHGVLLLLPTRGRTHVFTIDRQRLGHLRLPHGAVDLRGDIDAFLEEMQQIPEPEALTPAATAAAAARLDAVAGRLAAMLLPAELQQRLAEWSALTLIGGELLQGAVAAGTDGGYLNHLPLECLPWTEPAGQPLVAGAARLGQRFAMDHCASLPLWVHLANTAPRVATTRWAALATLLEPGRAPTAADRFARATFDPALAAFGEALFLDDDADRAGLGKAAQAVGGDGVLLLVGHGGYDQERERGAYMQFTGFRLDCELVESLGRPGRPVAGLTVLAGCKTGKGPSRPGDGLANLGGAFLAAGSGAVVQSRFDLPLHRTLGLLQEAFAALRGGAGAAEAFRAARAAERNRRDALDGYRTGVVQVHGYGQRGR